MSTSLPQQIDTDLKTAMKEKDMATLGTLRMLKSAVKNAAIEKGGASAVLTDAETVAVIRKQIKQREDSAASYKDAGRSDLEEKEVAEIAVLQKYLPPELSAEQIEKMVEDAIAEAGATSKKDMGAVMKVLQEKSGGQVDNKTLSQEVMKRLS